MGQIGPRRENAWHGVITNSDQNYNSKETLKTGAKQTRAFLKKLKVGPGAIEDRASSVDRVHPLCALFRGRKN